MLAAPARVLWMFERRYIKTTQAARFKELSGNIEKETATIATSNKVFGDKIKECTKGGLGYADVSFRTVPAQSRFSPP